MEENGCGGKGKGKYGVAAAAAGFAFVAVPVVGGGGGKNMGGAAEPFLDMLPCDMDHGPIGSG